MRAETEDQRSPNEPPLSLSGAFHLVSRRLCDALDRAVHLGQFEQAERIAASAERLAHRDTRLSERLARLRLARGDAEGALRVIERCRHDSASIRLLRNVCLIKVGRVGEAHVDLHRWSRRASAPTDARLLLALLEWSTVGPDAALDPLRENLRHLADLDTLQLLTLSAFERGLNDQAGAWASRLRALAAFGRNEPAIDLLLGAVEIDGTAAAADLTERANILALELTAEESVIPILVEAHRLEPDEALRGLLVSALEACVDDLRDRAMAMAALGRLALDIGDVRTARRWAEQALEANPMSAPAALVLQDCGATRPVTPETPDELTHGRAA